MSEGAYKRRGLYPRGLINGRDYILGGLQMEQKRASKQAITVLIKIRFVKGLNPVVIS